MSLPTSPPHNGLRPEPTVREAYESLVLEHATLKASQKALLQQVGQALVALMGRNKVRTFTVEQWEKAAGKTVRMTPQPDGSIQLEVE